MKAYSKTVFRTLKSNLGRFVAISLIILLGIAFVSGLGTLSPTFKATISDYLAEKEVTDIIIKSTSTAGFSESEIAAIENCSSVKKSQSLTVMDTTIEDLNSRLYVLPIEDMGFNKISLVAGELPLTSTEILLDRTIDKYKIGDKFEVMGQECTIVGIADNPLLFSKDGEPDIINNERLDLIIYLNSEHILFPVPISDIFVKVKNTEALNLFSDSYKSNVSNCINELKLNLDNEAFVFLSLSENKSYAFTQHYSDKIEVISLIFPIFFIAVAALVVLTTMTRLIEEERSILGCYRTLGYSKGKIKFKYLLFSFLCCIIGIALGILVGVTLLPAVLFPAFECLFFLPPISGFLDLTWGLVSSVAMILVVSSVTLYVLSKDLKLKSADLLKTKAPKASKKILLEKIPFIWKHLKFKYKSSFRNIFRYKKHLIMTVVSVAGSTALVLAGFGLYNVCKDPGARAIITAFADSFATIALLVILFAAVLCVLVIYNLTNMNIGERKREIATLKVLGYHLKEVCSYIYREILIMSIFGILIGLPLGAGLVSFIFTYLEFGSISSVMWYSYVITAGLVIAVIGLVDLLLFAKIKNIDMNTSLKTVE